jgi:hypothetical protein
MNKRRKVKELLSQLNKQPKCPFPPSRQKLSVPTAHGVYVIRNKQHRAMHVGRTLYGQDGLLQRLKNHLAGKSSFVRACFHGKGASLRRGFTYQFLKVADAEQRLLLEYAATVWHCPKHLAVGSKSPAVF